MSREIVSALFDAWWTLDGVAVTAGEYLDGKAGADEIHDMLSRCIERLDELHEVLSSALGEAPHVVRDRILAAHVSGKGGES